VPDVDENGNFRPATPEELTQLAKVMDELEAQANQAEKMAQADPLNAAYFLDLTVKCRQLRQDFKRAFPLTPRE